MQYKSLKYVFLCFSGLLFILFISTFSWESIKTYFLRLGVAYLISWFIFIVLSAIIVKYTMNHK